MHSRDRSLRELRKLSLQELQHLADDIRQRIISVCLKNGGHLGASLGAVELAISLHHAFESPRDALIWDVGHQAYAHKLLTGRWEAFETLRKTGGISGFLSRNESEHDVFGAGHSSTALSAALGISWGKARKNDDTWTVAIVGDGGLTAGLAFEALNNVSALDLSPFLLIVNDNQMSISENVGAVASVLGAGTAPAFFGSFGFDYVGPVDGNNLELLLGTLRGIREGKPARPVVLHILTQKGKGYLPAEESPSNYHGVSPVPAKVAAKAEQEPRARTYSEAFGEALCALAESDDRVIAITAAMTEGTGLAKFAKRFPGRLLDVGIAEQHAVTFAAGAAIQGFRPVVAIYSSFLQRALDQVIHDVCLQKLPVTFAVDRAGLVGADGPTHHGAFDLVFSQMIPELSVYAPGALQDLAPMLAHAVNSEAPALIRYPRGTGPESLGTPVEAGLRWHSRSSAPGLIVVALGTAVREVLQATRGSGESLTVISCVQAKPIPAALLEYLERHGDTPLLLVEDGAKTGGFSEVLLASLQPRPGPCRIAAYPDSFVPHGSTADLQERLGLSGEALARTIEELLNEEAR